MRSSTLYRRYGCSMTAVKLQYDRNTAAVRPRNGSKMTTIQLQNKTYCMFKFEIKKRVCRGTGITQNVNHPFLSYFLRSLLRRGGQHLNNIICNGSSCTEISTIIRQSNCNDHRHCRKSTNRAAMQFREQPPQLCSRHFGLSACHASAFLTLRFTSRYCVTGKRICATFVGFVTQ